MSERPESSGLRHEIKFIAEATRIDAILAWLAAHEAAFREPYPERQVNNVYFDGPALHAFYENLSGTSRRSKVRYRWYGDTWRPASGTLEIKRRRGGLGWKLSHETIGLDFEAASWRALARSLRRALPARARLWLDAHPQPVLVNRYRRRYFVSRDRLVRLTLDREQRVFDQRRHGRPNHRWPANLPQSLVVELKFAPADRRRAQAIVQGLPLRLSRNSKYVIAAQAASGGR